MKEKIDQKEKEKKLVQSKKETGAGIQRLCNERPSTLKQQKIILTTTSIILKSRESSEGSLILLLLIFSCPHNPSLLVSPLVEGSSLENELYKLVILPSKLQQQKAALKNCSAEARNLLQLHSLLHFLTHLHFQPHHWSEQTETPCSNRRKLLLTCVIAVLRSFLLYSSPPLYSFLPISINTSNQGYYQKLSTPLRTSIFHA